MGMCLLGSKMAAPQRFRNCQRIFETALRRLKLAAIPRQSRQQRIGEAKRRRLAAGGDKLHGWS